ncbi:MAG: biopolymer transporter ExbD [Azoarcus sp.]|jgi:biopolymer transport protein TolR|nr:biopolymer transporter ExbD [Azoarcus sp.]
MRQRRLKNEINVVPYIDVMLVLLVIFMVTAPMMQSGNIEIPSAGPLVAPPQEAAVVEVDRDGKFAVRLNANAAARSVSAVELQREIKQLVETGRPLLVAAHNELPYQKVIDVLEAAREMGAKKVSLQTKSSGSK